MSDEPRMKPEKEDKNILKKRPLTRLACGFVVHLKSEEGSHFCFEDGIHGDVLDLIKGLS